MNRAFVAAMPKQLWVSDFTYVSSWQGMVSEEQIIAILKSQESGVATADLCCEHGISSATFYKWKAKFGGLEVSDAWWLRPSTAIGHDSSCK